MAAKNLEDIGEKIDNIHETVSSLDVGCCCPTKEDLEEQFQKFSKLLLKVIPCVPVSLQKEFLLVIMIGPLLLFILIHVAIKWV